MTDHQKLINALEYMKLKYSETTNNQNHTIVRYAEKGIRRYVMFTAKGKKIKSGMLK
jgi:hypothetical protein